MSLPEAGGSKVAMTANGAVRWRRLLLAFALLGTPFLAACDGGFRPLYGSSSSGIGSSVNEKLAQVEVTQIPGRVGQRVRNELMDQATGGGAARPPTMRLDIALRESVTSTLVRIDGEAEGRVYNLEAAFNLIRISDNAVVLKGTSYARAGFERFESIFSNVRAREDAENRAAKTIGEDLKSRLAAFLSQPA